MWYEKQTNQTALIVAGICGNADLFAAVGPVIHKDDLPKILEELGATSIGFEINGNAVAASELLFRPLRFL
jgi:hypothetical protein